MYVHDPAYIYTFEVIFSSQATVRHMRGVASKSYPIDLEDISNIELAFLSNFDSFKRRLFYILLSRIQFRSHNCQISLFFHWHHPYVSARRISYTSYKRIHIMLMNVYVILHLFFFMGKKAGAWFRCDVTLAGELWNQTLDSQRLISLLLACSCARLSCARTDTISEVRSTDPNTWGRETARKDKRERTRQRERAGAREKIKRVQKLDTHWESTRETSSSSESESESVERAERASAQKKGAHRHRERVGGRERKTKRKTETEGQRGTETEIKREIETESNETERQGEGQGGLYVWEILYESGREQPASGPGGREQDRDQKCQVSQHFQREYGSGQGQRVDYTAQSPKHARTTMNRRTHSASPMVAEIIHCFQDRQTQS